MTPSTDLLWPTLIVASALIFVFTWWARRRYRALLATIEVVVLPAVASTHLGNSRDISVYLPPDYHKSERHYPVLYINDGQDMAALRLRETMARLISRGEVRPFIAVAIPANDNRLQEYGTAVMPNAQGFGTLAAEYACFVIEELRPLVNGRFRILGDADHTAILGASLGGLSAFDIAWNHRDRFGKVGIFSGSFWWRAADDSTADRRLPTADCLLPRPGHLIAHEMVRCSGYRPGFRMWFEAGTRDEVSDRDHNGVIDAIQDTLELIEALEESGYRRGRDIEYVEVLGGRHEYETWAKCLEDFLEWVF